MKLDAFGEVSSATSSGAFGLAVGASATDLVRVTAFAASAVEAEVLAKSLLLSGAAEASRAGVPAVLVGADGSAQLVGGIG